MSEQSFTTTFTVDRSPEEVVAAITDVRRWWTGDVDGETSRPGDEFTYTYPGMHRSRQRVTEVAPGRVAWHVVDAHLAFAGDPAEWTGTDITFDVIRTAEGTEVRFAHVGLIPAFECYDNCANAWGFFVNGSLRRLITTGEGPTPPPWA